MTANELDALGTLDLSENGNGWEKLTRLHMRLLSTARGDVTAAEAARLRSVAKEVRALVERSQPA